MTKTHGIDARTVIGNAFISTKRNKMTREEIYQFWEIVDALLPNTYYTLGRFDSFFEYWTVITLDNDTCFVNCDTNKLIRYYRIGIPTEVINIFDIAGTKFNEIKMEATKELSNNENNGLSLGELVDKKIEELKKNDLDNKRLVLKK